MKTRLITAGILVPLLLIMILGLPEIVTAVVMGLVLSIGAYELLMVTNLVKHTRLVIYAMIAGFLVSLWSCFGMDYGWGMLGLLAFFALLFGEMMHDHVKLSIDMLALTRFAGILIPFLLSAVVRIITMRLGRQFVMVPFLMAFMPDSGAYFAGIAFGQHKLAPVISPKKTVEGMIGGILAGMLSMVIYALILQLGFSMKVNYMYALVYGLVGALAATFSDLCFSVIKRQTGIKDYGSIFPGHGGVLDRFDSLVIVAPLAEVLLRMIPLAGV